MPFLGGISGALTTPPSNVGGTFSSALGWVLTWSNGLLSQGTRIYRTDSEEIAEQPGSLFLKVRLTPVSVAGTTFVDKFEPRPGITYVYYLCSLDIFGNESVQASFTAVTPNVPQNHLNLWNRDLTKTATADGGTTISGWFHWKGDSGVTAVASVSNVGATTLSFGAANKAFYQTISTYDLNRAGALYTVYVKVKGTAGQTWQVFAHGDNGVGGQVTNTLWESALQTFTGGVDEVALPRTVSTAGARFIRFGLQTYNGATARTYDVYELRMAAGNRTLSQMQADSALVQGPGTTWHEPIAVNQSTTMTGHWFRSQDAAEVGRACVALVDFDNLSLTLNQVRTDTESGPHFFCNKGSWRYVTTNCRHYGRTPHVQGAHRGYVMQGDYAQHIDMQNFYAYRTAGISAQFFRGLANAANFFRVRNYFYRELDGKNYNADGTPVANTWGGVNISQGPTSLASGSIICNAVGLRRMDGSGSSGSITNPNGQGIIGGENAYGVTFARPGWSKFEDWFNYSEVRGTSTSPFRTHDNMVFGMPSHDFEYFNGTTPTYNMGRQLVPYTQTITTTAATTGTGSATTLTVSALTGPVPPNQNFTIGGQTLQASSEAVRGSTTINVKAFTGTVASGASASPTFKWGPAIVSSTGGLVADGGRYDRWEQNGAYHETYNCLAIGPELILTDQNPGNDRNLYASEVWIPTTLMDQPVTISTLSRNYGYQNFTSSATIPDINSTPQPAVQNVSFYSIRTYGGGASAYVSGGYPSWKTAGHAILPTPTPAACWARAQRFMDELAASGVTIGPA